MVIHSADPDVFLFGEPRRAALERGNAFVDELADGWTVDERVVDVDDPARLVTAVAAEGAGPQEHRPREPSASPGASGVEDATTARWMRGPIGISRRNVIIGWTLDRDGRDSLRPSARR
jgi:hypothetical protein